MREEYKKGGKAKDPRLKRAGVSGYNKPKRTPNMQRTQQKEKCQQRIGLIRLNGKMPQIGSNEKPVLMTNKKNGGRIGKGSRPRKISVSQQQFDDNWDRIFKK